MAILGAFIKQPKEVENYTINYSRNFSADERITAFDIQTSSPELIIQDKFFDNEDNPHIRVWIAGGVDKQIYKITVIVHTTQGRVLEDEFKIKIKEF